MQAVLYLSSVMAAKKGNSSEDVTSLLNQAINIHFAKLKVIHLDHCLHPLQCDFSFVHVFLRLHFQISGFAIELAIFLAVGSGFSSPCCQRLLEVFSKSGTNAFRSALTHTQVEKSNLLRPYSRVTYWAEKI